MGHGECWVRSDGAGVLVAEALEAGTGPGPRTLECRLGFVSWPVTNGDLWAFARAPWQLRIMDLLRVGVDGKLVRRYFYGMRDMMVVSGKGQGTLDTTLNTPHSSALSHVLNSWVTWG